MQDLLRSWIVGRARAQAYSPLLASLSKQALVSQVQSDPQKLQTTFYTTHVTL